MDGLTPHINTNLVCILCPHSRSHETQYSISGNGEWRRFYTDVWDSKLTLRLIVCLCRAIRDKCSTKGEVEYKRQCVEYLNATGDICVYEDKNLQHVLFDCGFSKDVWWLWYGSKCLFVNKTINLQSGKMLGRLWMTTNCWMRLKYVGDGGLEGMKECSTKWFYLLHQSF